MAMLRIKFTTINNELIPTLYRLTGVSEYPTEDTYYYNLSRVTTNMYLGTTGVIFCYRKIDFSQMADNEVKNVQGVGGKIKVTMRGTCNGTAGALQCVGWGCHLLSNLNSPLNSGKQKLPQYLLAANDLTQLKENIHFHIMWGDNKDTQKDSNKPLKFVDITLNLFVDNN
jgi:hypothetical protein